MGKAIVTTSVGAEGIPIENKNISFHSRLY